MKEADEKKEVSGKEPVSKYCSTMTEVIVRKYYKDYKWQMQIIYGRDIGIGQLSSLARLQNYNTSQ